MWTRSELKARAKQTLRGDYWTAFGAYAVPNLIIGTLGGILYLIGVFIVLSPVLMELSLHPTQNPDAYIGAGTWMLVTGLLVLLLGIVLCYIALLALPLSAGIACYFSRAAVGRARFNDVFFAFRKQHYTGIAAGMTLYAVRICLWALLLVVPGIVKGYSYLMTPYLLSDNPHLGARRAIALSRAMMRGQKWRAFVLNLSFLGWTLLAMLPFGLGQYFLQPYLQATFAELYQKLRAAALQSGLTSPEELNLVELAAQPQTAPVG